MQIHASSVFEEIKKTLSPSSVFEEIKNKINKRALGPWVAYLRMTDQRSGTFCEILVECIMRNNSVKFFLILGQWFSRRCHLKDFLSGALAVLLFGATEPFMQF